MNAYNEVDGDSVHRVARASDRAAARRVGLRRLHRLRLLRRPSARHVSPARRRRPEAAAAALVAGHRRRAAEHRLLRRAAARGARARARSPRRTSTSQSAACSRRSSPWGSSSSRTSTRRPLPRRRARTGTARLARTIAEKSLVLLRNDGVLPLAPALEGRGDRAERGHGAEHARATTATPAHIESLSEMARVGRERLLDQPAGSARVRRSACRSRRRCSPHCARGLATLSRFARGCDVNSESREGFDEAVALAAAADVAVLVVGDKAGLTDDSTSGESRDRSSLDLPGVQEEPRARGARDRDARRARARRRTAVRERRAPRAERAPCCSRGSRASRAAEAIADALTGATSPGGKLPITFPRSVGQIPVYYGHKVSGGRSHWKGDYVDGPVAPLYPFGHGLAYTTLRARPMRRPRRRSSWTSAFTCDRARHERRRRSQATRSFSCTSATPRRASRGPCWS